MRNPHNWVEAWGAVTAILTALAGFVRAMGWANTRAGKVAVALAVDVAGVRTSLKPPVPKDQEASQ